MSTLNNTTLFTPPLYVTSSNTSLKTLLINTTKQHNLPITVLFNITHGTYNTTTAANKTLGLSLFAFDVDAFKLFMAILYGVIFLLGVPGNILVIMSLIRVPKMRSVKNLFIANLAVGDLINVLWCIPTSLVSLYIAWPYGNIVCKYIFPMADVVIGNTIATMVSITIDRYRAICYPFAIKLTLRKTILVILLTWIASYCLMGLPLVMAAKVSTGYWVARSCNTHWKSRAHELAYRICTFVVLFCIPFVVVLFCFIRIKKTLLENIKFSTASMRGQSKLIRAKKNQVLVNMLLVIFLCFTMCFLPINVLLLTVTFHPRLFLWKYAGIIFQLAIALFFFNSIMNPIILYKLSYNYRAAYYQQLKFLCPNSKKFTRSMSLLRRSVSSNYHHHSRTSTLVSLDKGSHSRTSSSASSMGSGILKGRSRTVSALSAIDNNKRHVSRTSSILSSTTNSNGNTPREPSARRALSVGCEEHYGEYLQVSDLNSNNCKEGKQHLFDEGTSIEEEEFSQNSPFSPNLLLVSRIKRKKSVTFSKNTLVGDEFETVPLNEAD